MLTHRKDPFGDLDDMISAIHKNCIALSVSDY